LESFKAKLLGFDKFQVLSSAGTDNADVEQVLLDSIKAYQGLLDSAGNPAFERSLEILKQIGLELDENGNIVGGFDTLVEKAKEFAKTLGAILFIVGIFVNPWLAVAGAIEYAYWTNEDFRESLNNLFREIFATIQPILDIIVQILQVLTPIISLISRILEVLSPILQVIQQIVHYLDPIMPYLLFTIATFLVPIAIGFDIILNTVESILEVIRTIFTFDWKNLGKNLSEIWSEKSGWDISVEAGKNVAKYGKMVIGAKANGGLATKGSLFYAGEAGPELVTQTSGGGSTIMNMQQLEDAVARGFIRGFAATDNGYENDDTTEVYVDGQRLFNIMRGTAKRNGYDFVKV